jgi:hypothetical protein
MLNQAFNPTVEAVIVHFGPFLDVVGLGIVIAK